MGTYDEVRFRCPNCQQRFTVQSRAGNPTLRRYANDNVPTCIAEDLTDEKVWCEWCEKGFTITTKTVTITTLELEES